MSRCSIRGALTPVLVMAGMAACAGCGGASSGGPPTENKLHAPSFSPDQLNAPLSSKAKSQGAQVAPPPMR